MVTIFEVTQTLMQLVGLFPGQKAMANGNNLRPQDAGGKLSTTKQIYNKVMICDNC